MYSPNEHDFTSIKEVFDDGESKSKYMKYKENLDYFSAMQESVNNSLCKKKQRSNTYKQVISPRKRIQLDQIPDSHICESEENKYSSGESVSSRSSLTMTDGHPLTRGSYRTMKSNNKVVSLS